MIRLWSFVASDHTDIFSISGICLYFMFIIFVFSNNSYRLFFDNWILSLLSIPARVLVLDYYRNTVICPLFLLNLSTEYMFVFVCNRPNHYFCRIGRYAIQYFNRYIPTKMLFSVHWSVWSVCSSQKYTDPIIES